MKQRKLYNVKRIQVSSIYNRNENLQHHKHVFKDSKKIFKVQFFRSWMEIRIFSESVPILELKNTLTKKLCLFLIPAFNLNILNYFQHNPFINVNIVLTSQLNLVHYMCRIRWRVEIYHMVNLCWGIPGLPLSTRCWDFWCCHSTVTNRNIPCKCLSCGILLRL